MGLGKDGGSLVMDMQHWSLLQMASKALLLVGCFFVTAAHFLMEPLRWNSCYQPVGSSARERRGVRDALFCTALATYILPFKLGIPLRIFLLQRHGGLTFHFLGVVMALDGLISLGVWALVTASCAWFAALHWSLPWYLWLALSMSTLICVIAAAAWRKLGLRMFQRLRDAWALLDHLWWRIGRSMAVLATDVLSYGLRHALLLLLVTGDFKNLLIGGSVGIIATFAGIVSGLPMGLVSYDATLVALLSVVGVSPGHALLIAVINRALNVASAVVLGIPAAMRLGFGLTFASIIKKFREIANGKA